MECPNCGAYNPEDRIQCWKCDDLLPTKQEKRQRRDQNTRMGMWTWIILIVLGALWVFGQCSAPKNLEPSSYRQQQPPAIMQPLI